MHAARNPYDAVAYPSLAFPNTHPDRLATMAILHGLSPAPVENSRVLEIACGDGGNLIPMAYAMPGATFVGFDLAGLPIERGQARIRELGLHNIRMFQADLLDAGTELGEFDYIIAHGLYSWVPKPVRDRLLKLCSELLSPEGVAFISYNALPGGYVRNAIREMMLYCMQGGDDAEREVAGAMEFVRLLLGARPENDAFRVLHEAHVQKMEERNAQAIYHDELSPTNDAVSIVEFAGHAAAYGLQYLSEAELPATSDPYYRHDLRSALEKVAPGDLLKQESMLDFMRVRKYRETLLCRAGCTVRRDFPAEHYRRLRFSSQALSFPDEAQTGMVFKLAGGIKMESNHPVATTLMGELEKAWPHSLSFEELEPRLAEAGFVLGADGSTLLMRLVVSKFIELHCWNAPVAKEISMRPRVSAYSRQEIRTKAQATTLLHFTVKLENAISQSLLGLLDGTHDRVELAALLKAEFPDHPAEEIEEGIEHSLEYFRRAGFLEG